MQRIKDWIIKQAGDFWNFQRPLGYTLLFSSISSLIMAFILILDIGGQFDYNDIFGHEGAVYLLFGYTIVSFITGIITLAKGWINKKDGN